VSLCGAAVVVALTLLIAGKGVSTIDGADRSDVFVVYAIPIGITVLVGAITGWRIAELE
jgi:hypothetical protein